MPQPLGEDSSLGCSGRAWFVMSLGSLIEITPETHGVMTEKLFISSPLASSFLKQKN